MQTSNANAQLIGIIGASIIAVFSAGWYMGGLTGSMSSTKLRAMESKLLLSEAKLREARAATEIAQTKAYKAQETNS